MTNYLFVLIYQVLIMVTPLITMPYIVRVLSVKSIGTEAYVTSVVQIFTAVATLGMGDYGRKVIAELSVNDEKKMMTVFWNLYVVQFIYSNVVVLLYLVFITFVPAYKELFIINIMTLLANVLDITWFYTGQENIRQIMMRNMIVRILSVILIFLLVTSSNGLTVYVLINSITLLIGQLVTWTPILRKKNKIKIKLAKVKKYMLPVLSFALVPIVTLIPSSVNKVVLGITSGPSEVGYFSQAFKLITIFLVLITAFSTVMSPQIIKSASNKDERKFQDNLIFSFKYMLLISLPIAGGLVAVAPTFIPFLLGKSFTPVVSNLQILAPSLFFSTIISILGVQILVSFGKNIQYTMSVIIAAVLSGIINIPLVNLFQSQGSSIAYLLFTVIAMLIQLSLTKKYLNIKKILVSCKKIFIAFFVMIFIEYLIGEINLPLKIIEELIIRIVIGALTYLTLLYVLKEPILYKITDVLAKKIGINHGNV